MILNSFFKNIFVSCNKYNKYINKNIKIKISFLQKFKNSAIKILKNFFRN